jgi:tetratricopeptide (TPR) repeat protein
MRGTLVLILLAAVSFSPEARAEGGEEAPSGPSVVELRRAGRLDEAVARAREILASDPGDLATHVAYQDVLRELGRTREAREEYRNAARAEGASADRLFLYARLLVGTPAIRQYRAALRLDPRYFEALCGLGSELTGVGKTRTARATLEKARTVRPESGVPLNALGWIEDLAGEVEAAERLYRGAIRLAPELVPAQVNLGLLLARSDRADEAVGLLARTVGRSPRDARARLALGRAQLAAGREAEALATFEAAIEMRGVPLATLNVLASSFLGMGRLDLAEKALARATSREGKDVSTLVNRALLSLAREDRGNARRHAREALRLDRRCAPAHYLVGVCEILDGRTKPAEAAYRRAVRLDPENPAYHQALRALYGSQGRWSSAVKAGETAARLLGDTPDALYDLAMTYVGAKCPRKAVAALERVVEMCPDRLEAWLNLGVLYQQELRDAHRAARAYREYLKRGGRDPRVRKWLADVER